MDWPTAFLAATSILGVSAPITARFWPRRNGASEKQIQTLFRKIDELTAEIARLRERMAIHDHNLAK